MYGRNTKIRAERDEGKAGSGPTLHAADVTASHSHLVPGIVKPNRLRISQVAHKPSGPMLRETKVSYRKPKHKSKRIVTTSVTGGIDG